MRQRSRWQRFLDRFRRSAIRPEMPADCILVLSVTDGRVHGWQTPDSYLEKGITHYRGTNYVFLTQKVIDCDIPPHSLDVDKEHREDRECESCGEEYEIRDGEKHCPCRE